MNDTTLTSDKLSRFKNNRRERKLKLIIISDDMIKDKKTTIWYQQKSSKNIDIVIWYINKNKYLTGKKILSSGQSRTIKQAIFTYSPLRKAIIK